MRVAAKLAWSAAAVTVVIAALVAIATRPDPIVTALPAAPPADQARVHFPPGRQPALTLPDGQRRTVQSLLNVTRPMRYGQFVWNDDDVPQGPTWIRIDLARQMLSVFRAGHEIGSAVILYGTDGKPTPSGIFPILARAEHHRSNLYDAEMPFMLRLTNDGVAIHASNVRRGSATHGCIGVPLGFARLMYAQVRRGDLVAILPAAAPTGEQPARALTYG